MGCQPFGFRGCAFPKALPWAAIVRAFGAGCGEIAAWFLRFFHGGRRNRSFTSFRMTNCVLRGFLDYLIEGSMAILRMTTGVSGWLEASRGRCAMRSRMTTEAGSHWPMMV